MGGPSPIIAPGTTQFPYEASLLQTINIAQTPPVPAFLPTKVCVCVQLVGHLSGHYIAQHAVCVTHEVCLPSFPLLSL